MRAHLFAILVLSIATPSVGAQQTPVLVPDSALHVFSMWGARAQAFTIRSSILEQVRRVSVVLPASFAEGSKRRGYPVIVVLDGEINVTGRRRG